MEHALAEIKQIQENHPRFRFTFPNMDEIRRLEAATARRRREVQKARSSVKELVELDPRALATLDSEQLDRLMELIEQAKRENK